MALDARSRRPAPARSRAQPAGFGSISNQNSRKWQRRDGVTAPRPATRPDAAIAYAAVVFANHAHYIQLRLAIRRHAVPAIHRRRTRIVGGQRQLQVVLVALQQRVQIRGPALNVLLSAQRCRPRPGPTPFPASTASAPALPPGSLRAYGQRSPRAPRWPADRCRGCTPFLPSSASAADRLPSASPAPRVLVPVLRLATAAWADRHARPRRCPTRFTSR